MLTKFIIGSKACKSPFKGLMCKSISFFKGKSITEDVKGIEAYALRLRGLPYTATKEEIMRFFKEYKLIKENIKIGVNKNNKPTGFAVVKFSTKEDLMKAYKQEQGKNIGSRWIELFLTDKEDYESFDTMQKEYITQKDFQKEVKPEDKLRVVHIRGLDFIIDEDYLYKEFEKEGIKADQIRLEIINGKKNGRAFVLAKTPEDALKIKEKYSGRYIGKRYLEIFTLINPVDIARKVTAAKNSAKEAASKI